MLSAQNVAYAHPNKDVLFDNLSLTLNGQQKAALIGNNGVGKSTFLKILAGELPPARGQVRADAPPYYLPQIFGQFNDLTIAQALGVEAKVAALHQILEGTVTEHNLAVLDDDWAIEERCHAALATWELESFPLTQPLGQLSGGQKTKVFLAGIALHQPAIVLLDEPSNHLDTRGRQTLYDLVATSTAAMLIVSHDRQLLNLLDSVYELNKRGITTYGGNYDFYRAQKDTESNALHQDVRSKEKALRKAREVERDTVERQQKLDARGRKKQQKAGLPTILLNSLKNSAENSTSRLKGVHTEKVGGLARELTELRSELPDTDQMKFGFDSSGLHTGKVLVAVQELNYGYEPGRPLWQVPLMFQITSGERIALKGLNGAGKTTLINLLLGHAPPLTGTVQRAGSQAVYIDQEYSLIDNTLSVYEQAQRFNSTALPEHEVKIRLNRFLFTRAYWDKPCRALSGGEKMRLMLCCLTIRSQAPDLIVLDEPTNNLDLQNIEILTAALNNYAGTLLVVSHDQYFLEQIRVERTIELA